MERWKMKKLSFLLLILVRSFSIPVRHCFTHFPLATIGGPLSALQIDIYERCRTKGSEPGGDECDKFYYADFNGQLRDSDVGFYSAIVNGPPTVALSATCSSDQSMIKAWFAGVRSQVALLYCSDYVCKRVGREAYRRSFWVYVS